MPEQFERESEEILKETNNERVSVEEARANTEKALETVKEDASQTNKEVLKESLNKQIEANSKLNKKAFEIVADKEFLSTEWKKITDYLNNLREVLIDYKNPTPENIRSLYDIYANNKTLSPEITDAAIKTTSNLSETTTTKTIENNTTSVEKNELKDIQDEVNTKSKKLKDLLEKGDQSPQGLSDTRDAVTDSQKSLEKLKTQIENNPKLKEKLISEGGRDYLYRFAFYAGLGSLSILGYFIVSKMYADAMSGCYQYNGTNQIKIPKPNDNNNPEWCSCGPSGNINYQPTLPDKICPPKNQCPNNILCNYPYCANGINSTTYPLCSDPLGDKKPNEDGYVYYSYTIKTVFDLPSDLIDDVKKEIGDLTSGLEAILMSILKWGGITLGVLLLLYIIYLIVNKTLGTH